MKPIVSISNVFPKAGLDILRPYCKVNLNESGTLPKPGDLARMVVNSDAIITYLSDKIDANMINEGQNLKIIANYAVGFNNIDFSHAEKKGIWVTNTPNVLHETTADLTWAMILCLARRIVSADRFTHKGLFKGWGANLFLGYDIYGKTLGIIGCGEIGYAVARRAIGFNMKVLYYQRHRISEQDELQINATYVKLNKLLKQSDFISLHLPLNEDSHYLIGKPEFTQMKKTAFLINAARGKVVDDHALLEAVRKKSIAGAALDVYENEPEITKGILKEEGILTLPHIGSASYETRDKMAQLVSENILDVLIRNRKPRTSVNQPLIT